MRRRDLLTTALLAAPLALAVHPAAAQGLGGLSQPAEREIYRFARQAAYANNFAIQSARILLARSDHPQLREYAQRLIEQRTAMNAALASIPAARAQVTQPLDNEAERALRTLQRQDSVEQLNRYFVAQQVKRNEDVLEYYADYAAGGGVPAVREYATRALPVISRDLAIARSLQRPREG
ncbi:MAG TPA: DUF4142 domain-containing protein [Falsiroseomonas sp.]|nr:DUF4142 domain-containing protein [Falsiroseomonas sp.]